MTTDVSSLARPALVSWSREHPRGLRAHRDLTMDWSELARDASPFLRPEFFALEEPLVGDGERLLVRAYREGKLAGALPLLRRGRRLESFAFDHTPVFDYLGDADAVDGIWHALRADRGWDTMVLERLPVTSVLLSRLPSLALADLCVTVVKGGKRSPFFSLPRHEDVLSSKLKHNLRRCANKLGDVELERVSGSSRAVLDEGLALEGAAWKGAEGTSIEGNETLRHFYSALARLSARHGELSLYFLRARGRRIAFLFALEDRETLFALKTGYDPAYSEFSPGQVLFAEVARDAERRGLLQLDFMGKRDDWKRRWTDRTHDQVTLVVYRPTVRGASSFVGRELVKPRLSMTSKVRLAALRSEALRRGRHCQRNDLVGSHSPAQRIVGRIRDGLGIKSGVRRVLSSTPAPLKPRQGAPSRFADGSWVRVKSEEDIRATLDAKSKLRGLVFVPSQFESCGRVYRVTKSTRRILDDHGEMRAVSRTALLEGSTCDGHTGGLGCGRHCPLMFRDEWLDPVDAPTEPPVTTTPTRWARVRPLSVIEQSLDSRRSRDGVSFMPEMARHTGKRVPIVRRLERVYELDRWTPPRAPIYLLQGLSCTGAALGDEGPCDRACALMWHGDWLELDAD